MFLLLVAILRKALYSTKDAHVFVQRIKRKNIEKIDIKVDQRYYSTDKQEIVTEAIAGPYSLDIDTIYYTNLRFSIYEYHAQIHSYKKALETARLLKTLSKDSTITIDDSPIHNVSDTLFKLNAELNTLIEKEKKSSQ